MKKLAAISASILAIGLAGNAFADDDEIVSRSYDLVGFDKIDVSGVYELDVRVGPAFSIELSGPENEMERVEASVKNGALHLEQRKRKRGEKRVNHREGIDAVITMPSMTALEISGVVEGTIDGVDAENFEVDLSGVGDVTIDGECGELDAKVSGVGDLDARGLKCRSVDVRVSGVGDADVFASEAVDARISGMGDIDVYGDPKDVRKDSGMFADITIK